MGGNNPLICWNTDEVQQAAHCIARSSWISAGQRCTCSRRLIIPEDQRGDQIIEALKHSAQTIVCGDPIADPQPFYGSVLSKKAAQNILGFAQTLADHGAKIIAPCEPAPGQPETVLRPGIIDISTIEAPDTECFGPLLLVQRVRDFRSAMQRANATTYGLSAGLIDRDPLQWELFKQHINAGVISWNRPTAGASGKMAFGGSGNSGNHRSLAWHAVDHCSDPVAALAGETLAEPELPGFTP